jgi:hypothetical protein
MKLSLILPDYSHIARETPEHRALALKAARQAAAVLPLFERAHPHDERPRAALAGLRAWARGKGELGMKSMRKLSLDAHAAARAAKNDAACFAARAAGQAVATWHVPNHAAGAQWYAAKARAAAKNG